MPELKDLDFVYDPFCEKEFWIHQNFNVDNFTNPICAVTGLFMTLMALPNNVMQEDIKPTDPKLFLFFLCKASLALIGIGTAIFHSMDDQSNVGTFNFRMADRFAMIFMCINVFILFFVKLCLIKAEFFLMLSLFILYLYVSGLVLAVDSSTYKVITLELIQNGEEIMGNRQNLYEIYMNIGMLVPLGLILLYATFTKRNDSGKETNIAYVWFWIIFNLIIWSVNAYTCREYPILFLLHALFHVTIAYTFLFAVCVGMTLDGEWKLEIKHGFWPMIQSSVSATKCKSMFTDYSTRHHPCDFRMK